MNNLPRWVVSLVLHKHDDSCVKNCVAILFERSGEAAEGRFISKSLVENPGYRVSGVLSFQVPPDEIQEAAPRNSGSTPPSCQNTPTPSP